MHTEITWKSMSLPNAKALQIKSECLGWEPALVLPPGDSNVQPWLKTTDLHTYFALDPQLLYTLE